MRESFEYQPPSKHVHFDNIRFNGELYSEDIDECFAEVLNNDIADNTKISSVDYQEYMEDGSIISVDSVLYNRCKASVSDNRVDAVFAAAAAAATAVGSERVKTVPVLSVETDTVVLPVAKAVHNVSILNTDAISTLSNTTTCDDDGVLNNKNNQAAMSPFKPCEIFTFDHVIEEQVNTNDNTTVNTTDSTTDNRTDSTTDSKIDKTTDSKMDMLKAVKVKAQVELEARQLVEVEEANFLADRMEVEEAVYKVEPYKVETERVKADELMYDDSFNSINDEESLPKPTNFTLNDIVVDALLADQGEATKVSHHTSTKQPGTSNLSTRLSTSTSKNTSQRAPRKSKCMSKNQFESKIEPPAAETSSPFLQAMDDHSNAAAASVSSVNTAVQRKNNINNSSLNYGCGDGFCWGYNKRNRRCRVKGYNATAPSQLFYCNVHKSQQVKPQHHQQPRQQRTNDSVSEPISEQPAETTVETSPFHSFDDFQLENEVNINNNGYFTADTTDFTTDTSNVNNVNDFDESLHQFVRERTELASMGFNDESMNTALLVTYEGRIDKVVDHYLSSSS